MLEDVLTDDDLWEELRGEVLAIMEPRFRAIFAEGMAVAQTIDVPGYTRRVKDFLDPDPGALDDMAGQVFRNYMDDWWLSLREATRERLRQAIMTAAADGTGVKAVIDAIEPLFGRARAIRIGVTETTRLFGAGAVATYRVSGLQQWEWMTVEDNRVCPTCDALAGQTFDLDAVDFAPAHVSCRCFPAPVA